MTVKLTDDKKQTDYYDQGDNKKNYVKVCIFSYNAIL